MIRKKYRWLLFEVFSDKKFSKEKILAVLMKKSQELFGCFGIPDFYLYSFDEEKQVGIIRCVAEDLDKVRVLLGFIKSIDGAPVLINDRFCSGTLNKLLEKTRDIIFLRDILGEDS